MLTLFTHYTSFFLFPQYIIGQAHERGAMALAAIVEPA